MRKTFAKYVPENKAKSASQHGWNLDELGNQLLNNILMLNLSFESWLLLFFLTPGHFAGELFQSLQIFSHKSFNSGKFNRNASKQIKDSSSIMEIFVSIKCR